MVVDEVGQSGGNSGGPAASAEARASESRFVSPSVANFSGAEE